MTLTDLRTKFLSFDFLRLLSLLGKRALSIIKSLLGWLPWEALQLVYGFHLARAVFRVANYCINTKNRNLGETRKLIFSLFKIAIAIAAIVFLASGLGLPFALSTAFLAYGLAKLADSILVFSTALIRYHQLQDTPENKWMRDQYWDVIQKHTSILAINFAITLLTTAMALGTVGAVVIGINSPILIFTLLPLVGAVTGALLVSLGICLYRRYKLDQGDLHAKEKANAEIKRFCALIGLWTLSSAVGVAITVLSLVLPMSAPLLCLVPIIAFLSIDMLKSTYDHFFSSKVNPPEPASLAPKNLLTFSPSENDYYYRRCRTLCLDPNNNKKNAQFLLAEGVIKLLELSRRAEASSKSAEVSAEPDVPSGVAKIKMGAIVANLGDYLRNSQELVTAEPNAGTAGTKDAIFIGWMTEVIGRLYEDRQQLEEELQEQNAAHTQQPSSGVKKTLLHAGAVLQQDLAELLDHLSPPSGKGESGHPRREASTHKDNLLIPLWERYNSSATSAGKRSLSHSHQAFFHHMSDTTDYILACERAQAIHRSSLGVRGN